jgi:uncharacterized protein (TIGR02001 family)
MFKSKLLNSLILAALSVPGVSMAADAPASPHTFTSNAAVVSDYLYRGISQTNAKPAIQGGFDYAHSSGFYAGVWGSSISWLTDQGTASSSQVELDTYLGFKNSFSGDFTYDIGFLRYNYPAKYPAAMAPIGGTTAVWVRGDTNEIYGALGYKWFTLKYSHSLGDLFALPNASGSNYLDLSASYPITDTGITLGGHIGKQTYKGITADQLAAAGTTPTYTDYKVSVSKDFSGYVLGLTYSSTNVKDNGYYSYAGANANSNLGKGTAVLSLSRTF